MGAVVRFDGVVFDYWVRLCGWGVMCGGGCAVVLIGGWVW